MKNIKEILEKRRQEGLLRSLRPITCRSKEKIYFEGKEYIDFASNDYLGLSSHPKLKEEAKKVIDTHGTSSSASRLMSGSLMLHHQLEDKVAQFKGEEAALVFNSGYQANVGIISALYQKGDCIFSDRLNHASIVDGIMLSRAKLFRFQHNDMDHLEHLLKRERKGCDQALIITETVFSMDGDRPPLKELVYLKEKYDCQIMVDEAHATGVFGRHGAGVVEEEGLQGKIDVIMGTFSKALGGFGAYVATSKRMVDYLINTCRGFIYSTALPASIIASNIASIVVVKEEPQRREILLELAEYLRQALRERGFQVRGSSQIIPIITGDNFRTVEFSKRLQEKGYWVLPVRPPTVPTGEGRLRLSLTFYHTKETIQRFVDDISAISI